MDGVVYGVKNWSGGFFAGEIKELIESIDALGVVDPSGFVMITLRAINVQSRNNLQLENKKIKQKKIRTKF